MSKKTDYKRLYKQSKQREAIIMRENDDLKILNSQQAQLVIALSKKLGKYEGDKK